MEDDALQAYVQKAGGDAEVQGPQPDTDAAKIGRAADIANATYRHYASAERFRSSDAFGRGDKQIKDYVDAAGQHLGQTVRQQEGEVSGYNKMRDQFDDQLFQQAKQHNLDAARERFSGAQENWIPYLQRKGIPFAGTVKKNTLYKNYLGAVDRFKSGEATQDDYNDIAAYERLGQSDRERGTGAQIGEGLLGAGKMVGEMAVANKGVRVAGGAVARFAGFGGAAAPAAGAVAPLTGGGLVGTLGTAAGFTARTAATAALTPSMVLDKAVENAKEKGGRFTDMDNLAPAVALGTLQTAIFGSLSEAGNVPGAGMQKVAQRLAAKTGLGLVEQGAADAIAGAAGLQTGYGVLGDLAEGKFGQAAKHTAMNAVLFGAFASLHAGNPEKVLKTTAEAMKDLKSQGIGPDLASATVNQGIEVAKKVAADNPTATPAELAKKIDATGKQGPAYELAKKLVEEVKEQPRPQVKPEFVEKMASAMDPEEAAKFREAMGRQPLPPRPAGSETQQPGFMRGQQAPTGGTPAPEPGTGIINPVQSGVPGIVSGAVEIPAKATQQTGHAPQTTPSMSLADFEALQRQNAQLRRLGVPENPAVPEKPAIIGSPPAPVAAESAQPSREAAIATPERSLEPLSRSEAAHEDLERLYDESGLTEREKHVLRERLIGRPHEEIGKDSQVAKVGGKPIGRERVRQIEEKAMAKLGANQSIADAIHAEQRSDARVDALSRGQPIVPEDLGRDAEAFAGKARKKISESERKERKLKDLADQWMKEADSERPDSGRLRELEQQAIDVDRGTDTETPADTGQPQQVFGQRGGGKTPVRRGTIGGVQEGPAAAEAGPESPGVPERPEGDVQGAPATAGGRPAGDNQLSAGERMRRSRPIPKAAQGEAVAEGIDPEDLHGLAKTIRAEDTAGVDAQNAVLKEVRSMLPGKGKLMGTENYQEWHDVPGLEEAAQYFRDRGRADLGDPNRLFELLQNGNRKPMTERQVYDQALKTLRERAKPTEPPPPDTDFNFGANELATMAGGKHIEGETVPNPMYRSDHHTALADRFGRDLSSADLPEAQKQQYARNFLEVLGRMTPEAARRANAAVKKATFFTDTTALGSQLSKISRKIADAIARGSEIGGAVDYERGDIYLDGRTELSDAPEVYAHELGHSVDGAGGSTKQALSNQSDWIFAWEKEIQGGNLGDYAAISPREGFAEFYRMAAGMGIDPAQIRERFPQAAKFFDSLGLLGEGKKDFTKPDQIFAQAINDGPVHGDVLKQELAPYQEPERIGKDEDELRRTPVLDAAVKFLADDSGALNLDQLGAKASEAYESIKRGVRGLSDHLNKLAGAKFPKISRISEAAGDAMAGMDTAREMGRLASADYIDRILGKDVTEEQAWRIGSAFHQERFDEAKDNYRNASAAYSQAAYNARQAGDTAGAAKWAAKATEYLRKATHVREFIGTKDSALKTMAEYQQVRNSPEYQEAMKRYQTDLTPSLEEWFKQAEGMQETDPINSLTQLDGRPFTAKVLEEGPQKPDYVGQPARGNLANRKLNKLGAAREAELASPNYETDMREIISHTIQSRVYLAKKAEAFRVAEREGVITWAKPGERVGNAERIDGVNPPKGTQAANQGETDLWVTKDENAHEEFRQALRIDKAATLPIIKQAADASTVGALISTMEATFHTLNNLTAMFKAGVNPVDIVTGFIKVAKGDSETMRRLVDLASIGVAKEGHEASMTYSPMNPLGWTGRFLETLDRSMRLALDKGFDRLSDGYFGIKALGDRVKPTEANRRDFINQLGNYSKGSQSRLVVLLRDLGIGPFATAGTNYIMQGVRAATLNPGVEAANWKQAVALRAEQLARVTSVIGSVAIANYLRWGRWDGDDNTPLGHLKLGEGKDGKTSTMNLAAFTGVPRGLRSLGLMSVAEGVRQDKAAGQITDDALKAIGMSAAHPAFGPLPAFIYTAFTGKDLVGRQLAEKVSTAKTPLGMARAEAEGRPPEGSSQMWQNLKTALWHAIPALGTALGKTGRAGEQKEPVERALEYLGPFAPQDRGRPEKRKRIGAR